MADFDEVLILLLIILLPSFTYSLADKGCSDDPCFPGAECIPQAKFNIDPRFPIPDDVDLRLYRCGTCPDGYEGDGETCTAVSKSTSLNHKVTLRFEKKPQ